MALSSVFKANALGQVLFISFLFSLLPSSSSFKGPCDHIGSTHVKKSHHMLRAADLQTISLAILIYTIRDDGSWHRMEIREIKRKG